MHCTYTVELDCVMGGEREHVEDHRIGRCYRAEASENNIQSFTYLIYSSSLFLSSFFVINLIIYLFILRILFTSFTSFILSSLTSTPLTSIFTCLTDHSFSPPLHTTPSFSPPQGKITIQEGDVGSPS